MANSIFLWPGSLQLGGSLGLPNFVPSVVTNQLYNDAGVLKFNGSVVGNLGDVVGPAVATANALVRFDSTTGKLIKNSAATLSDTTAILSLLHNSAALILGAASDVILSRDAANILALKNGTTPQLFRSYTLGLAATSSRSGISILNNIPATAGVPVQMSGSFEWQGTAWDVDDAVSRNVIFGVEVLPASGNTPSGTWKLKYIDPVSGAVIYPMVVDSGTGATAGVRGINFFADTNFNIISTGAFRSSSYGAKITIPADGQFDLLNDASTAGIGFDVTTDAVLKVRTRAQTGYATMDCLGLKASGAAGASYGPGIVTSITVVNGIVTACS